MDWKDVFDSSKKWWGNIDNLIEHVYNSGYLYFTWEESIYVYGILGNTVFKTKILVSQVK